MHMRQSKEREMRGEIMGAGKSNDYANSPHIIWPPPLPMLNANALESISVAVVQKIFFARVMGTEETEG